jgi:hypothetical protein
MEKKKIPVCYYSNNSGGRDWLKDKDWDVLRKNGWELYGFNNTTYLPNGDRKVITGGFPKRVGEVTSPKYAYKYFDSIKEAMVEFEKLTGQDITDEGCNCCGAPHEFTWGACVISCECNGPHNDYHYSSGEKNAQHLLGEDLSKLSKRELLTKPRQ